MKVKFLKKHAKYSEGEEVDLEEGIAAYLLRVGVATIEDAPEDQEVEQHLTKKLKAAKAAAAKHPARAGQAKQRRK